LTKSLTEIARSFGTDKAGIHHYTPHYSRHLGHLRGEAFTMLEIGIGGYDRESQGGASLRMWKEFFPEAQILGLDIEDKSFVDEARIRSFQGDQTDEALLRRIEAEHGPLVVVIDDGSHRPEHIRETFRILFPRLPEGGIYAIEDTQTSYWPEWGGSEDRSDAGTTMALVKDLVDGLNYEEYVDESYAPSYTDLNVVAVHCYHNLVFIEKGENREGTHRRQILKDRYDALRVASATDRGVPLPPVELRISREDDATLVEQSVGLGDVLRGHGLDDRARVLDIGSGYGRLAIGLKISDFGGSYRGFDVLPRQVAWCQEHLASDGYDFVRVDIRNERYNKAGAIAGSEATFPAADSSVDCCAAFGVFTHMFEADLPRQLSEIRRVLTPGGFAVTTWFLYDESRLAAVTSPESRFPMTAVLNDHCRSASAEDPLRAIAYDERFVRDLAAAAGLEVRSVGHGKWAGGPGTTFQDEVVLTLPGSS